ncbi:MAG: recombinase family protein [Oscillospiraceae bacterium]
MNAVIYARYSPGPQQTETSIEGQLRECSAYAKKLGITIVNTYTDSAQSGHTDNRLEFQKMLRDSKSGLFDAVIVWKVNRFGRNREEIIFNKVRLKKNGVKVLYAAESIPEGKDGVLLESLLEGLAEYQWHSIREDVIRGMREGAFNCKYNGAGLALGFAVDSEKHYQIDPDNAEIVRQIFRMYDGGDSVTNIIGYLNSRGVKTSRGNPFSHMGIARILQNQQYIGVYRWQDISILDGIPKIVDPELFERVQERMNKRKKAPARPRMDDFLLTSKLFCGNCQGAMAGDSGTGKSGRKWYYYTCLHRKRNHTCDKRSVKKDDLENLVVKTTAEYILRDDMIDYIADLVMTTQENELNDTSMLEYYEKQLRETETAIKNIMRAIEQGIITSTTRDRLVELEESKRIIAVEIAKEQIVHPKFEKDQIVFYLESFRGGDVDDKEYQRKIIDTFVHKIILYDGKIVITFNYSGTDNEVSVDMIDKSAADAEENASGGCSDTPPSPPPQKPSSQRAE